MGRSPRAGRKSRLAEQGVAFLEHRRSSSPRTSVAMPASDASPPAPRAARRCAGRPRRAASAWVIDALRPIDALLARQARCARAPVDDERMASSISSMRRLMSLLLAASSLAALAPSPLCAPHLASIAHRAPAPLLASAAAAPAASVAAAAAAKAAKFLFWPGVAAAALVGAVRRAAARADGGGAVPRRPRAHRAARLLGSAAQAATPDLRLHDGRARDAVDLLGDVAFIGVFAAMAVVAENGYYAMARANGVFPTKLGTLSSVACTWRRARTAR